MIDIVYVDDDIAARYKDRIEIHKDLINHPTLFEPILKHEFEHSDKEFSTKDFYMDIAPQGVNIFEMYLFMLNHPKTLKTFLPIYYEQKRGFIYNINLSIAYVLFIAAIVMIYVFLK